MFLHGRGVEGEGDGEPRLAEDAVEGGVLEGEVAGVGAGRLESRGRGPGEGGRERSGGAEDGDGLRHAACLAGGATRSGSRKRRRCREGVRPTARTASA